jgi:autoinducer 2-degrading protein
MVVTTVRVNVKPEHVDEFVDATVANHERSVKEPGNMRFDILRADDDPGLFLLYEAYETAKHAAAHKDTEHYRRWRDTVAPWMAEPRTGTKYTAIRP